MTTAAAPDIKALIKDVPDFPKKGIVFKDITPLLADPAGFKKVIDDLAAPFLDKGVTVVAGIESRGFLLATPVAYRLGAGVVPIRKKGKLPRQTHKVTYALEYGDDTIEAHADALGSKDKVLLIDDVLATGGTAKAACELISTLGGSLEGVCFLIELGFLKGREKIPGKRIHSLVTY